MKNFSRRQRYLHLGTELECICPLGRQAIWKAPETFIKSSRQANRFSSSVRNSDIDSLVINNFSIQSGVVPIVCLHVSPVALVSIQCCCSLSLSECSKASKALHPAVRRLSPLSSKLTHCHPVYSFSSPFKFSSSQSAIVACNNHCFLNSHPADTVCGRDITAEAAELHRTSSKLFICFFTSCCLHIHRHFICRFCLTPTRAL